MKDDLGEWGVVGKYEVEATGWALTRDSRCNMRGAPSAQWGLARGGHGGGQPANKGGARVSC